MNEPHPGAWLGWDNRKLPPGNCSIGVRWTCQAGSWVQQKKWIYHGVKRWGFPTVLGLHHFTLLDEGRKWGPGSGGWELRYWAIILPTTHDDCDNVTTGSHSSGGCELFGDRPSQGWKVGQRKLPFLFFAGSALSFSHSWTFIQPVNWVASLWEIHSLP